MTISLGFCDGVTSKMSFSFQMWHGYVLQNDPISCLTQTWCTFRFAPSELSRVGDVIGQVRAVDVDEDNQAEVFYQITSGNQKGERQISYLLIPAVDLLQVTSKIKFFECYTCMAQRCFATSYTFSKSAKNWFFFSHQYQT